MMSYFSIGTGITIGIMLEDVKEIVIVKETVIEIEKGKGIETDTEQETTRTMVVTETVNGKGKAVTEKEEIGTVEGVGAARGAGAETDGTGILKKVTIGRGVPEAVSALAGGKWMRTTLGRSPRRKRKRKKRKAMELITQIQKLPKLIDYELLLG